MKPSMRALLAITLSIFRCFSVASSQTFVSNPKGCVAGTSGDNCPKKWEVSGGPGSVNNDRESWPTRVYCSPSCADSSSPSQCSLIIVLHGIFMNLNSMEWLLLGSMSNANGHEETFNESISHGGPFCISFHKAAEHGWSYSCEGDDADHLEAFILWARDQWPIDHDAVFIHGFSSGGIMINNLMNTHCKVEPLIAGAAPYGSGNVRSAPTTKAAYLIGMGTHDNIVAYKYTYIDGRYFPSCDCNTNLGTPGGCLGGQEWLSLQTEQLATAIAVLRGYDNSIYGTQPSVSSTLDLIIEDETECQNGVNNCLGPYQINTGYTCATLPQHETDVIEYPIDPNSNAGPVVVWRMNLRNHDYPNKRRVDPWGPTEFFFQLKLFFHANRGRRTFPGNRSVNQINSNVICASPDSYALLDPDINSYRRSDFDGSTPEECRLRCLGEKHCTEAFYLDPGRFFPHTACQMFYGHIQCQSTKFSAGVHFKATVTLVPTSEPSPTPSSSPSLSMSPSTPSIPPPNDSFCSSTQVLDATAEAGFACIVGDVSVGDSNAGFTQDQCTAQGGIWTQYTCSSANEFWISVGGDDWEHAGNFGPIWNDKCCDDEAPSQIPTMATVNPPPSPSPPAPQCPPECDVTICIFLGTDGPGWDPSWTRDEDGTATHNGFCTNYCQEYAPNQRLCGNGAWHKQGVDCSKCEPTSINPIIPEDKRAPSSGLCKETASLSGHIMWGKGIKQCDSGPAPTTNDRCTVYQRMNGDVELNPLRTCGSFCESFALTCINAYDDGGDGCNYGGSGIGCDSELGCCSEGGPTPDHVCVCGPSFVNESPSKSPSENPTIISMTSPSESPTEISTRLLTTSPSDSSSDIPTEKPSNTPSETSSKFFSTTPIATPSMNPSLEPSVNVLTENPSQTQTFAITPSIDNDLISAVTQFVNILADLIASLLNLLALFQ